MKSYPLEWPAGCALRVQKTTDTLDLRTGKSTETVTECYAFEMVSVEDPCKKKETTK